MVKRAEARSRAEEREGAKGEGIVRAKGGTPWDFSRSFSSGTDTTVEVIIWSATLFHSLFFSSTLHACVCVAIISIDNTETVIKSLKQLHHNVVKRSVLIGIRIATP